MHELAIDIETFSSNDIKKGGVYKYVEAEDFDILLVSYAIDGGLVVTLDLTTEEGRDHFWYTLKPMLLNPSYLKTAYNANFERTALAEYIVEEMPAEQWECTMVRAGRLGLPMNLESCAQVLGVDQQKMKEGKALIRFFSIPCKPTKTNGGRTRNMPVHDPAKWATYKTYNAQDVATELAIRKKIEKIPVHPPEIPLWNLDQEINDNGIRVDMQLVHNAIELDRVYKEKLMAEAVQLTGLNNPNSAAQLKEWLQEETFTEIKTLRKGDIPGLMEAHADDATIIRVLELRKEMAKTSVRKYAAMAAAVCEDGCIRGVLQFGGANRTMRWAGRLVQVHNLPQNNMHHKDYDLLDFARRCVLAGDLETLELVFGNVPDVLSQLVRTAFIPRKGFVFGVQDFSAIEARVIAWLAGEQWRLDVFATHGKIYEASASKMFKVPLEEITKDSPLRKKGKVSELALGYQGGKNALIKMGAYEMGLEKKELKPLVDRWREENPNTVQLWADVQDAATSAILQPGEIFYAGKCEFKSTGSFLFIKLPSGRKLSYVRPKLEETLVYPIKLAKDHGEDEEGDVIYCTQQQASTLTANGIGYHNGEPFTRYGIVYEGLDQTTKKWGKQHTYGGKLVENIVQATARDILAEAMMNCRRAGFLIVMHVHDEIVFELMERTAQEDLKRIAFLMSMPVSWAVGLPLGVDGFITNYYKKD